uniref:SSD domain-containing protein n=1 Tax=Parascaris univalens TaxID=6257 RepID=A0A915BTH5_PARUN
MRFDCVQRRLALLFANYARFIVFFPWPFIILPSIVTVSLGSGLLRHSVAFIKDELDLYTPTDALARRELQQLDTLFHINDSDPFFASRRYDIKRSGYIIVTNRVDGGEVLSPTTIRAAVQLWSIVQSLTVNDRNDQHITYPSICVKFPLPPEFIDAVHAFFAANTSTAEQMCVSNPFMEAFKFILLNESTMLNRSNDRLSLTQISDIISVNSVGFANLLGGVTLDDHRRIAGAKAMMLPYALRHSTEAEDRIAEKWELKLADYLHEYESSVIRVSWWTYETLASESAGDREQLKKMLLPCFIALSLYTVICCCVASSVRSRPWLGLGGVLSAAMAIISAIGLLLLCGYNMTSVACSMPFIIFSVGVDNVFILLSAWRSTNVGGTLERRMMDTFSDAAVSITATSMTDLISFAVGCMAPFPSVQMFCVYAVTAVFFTYIYQLTFFAGVMVLTGKREVDGRHCLTFLIIKKSSIDHFVRTAPVKKLGDRFDKVDYGNEESWTRNHMMAKFFRTTYSDALLQPIFRVAIIITFIAYIGLATWGCVNVKFGLEPNDLLPDNSYGKRTLLIAEKYFSGDGNFLHVWMYNLSTTNFKHRKIWKVLEKEIALYEYTEFTGSSDSWLRSFTSLIQQSNLLITSENFVYLLRNLLLSKAQYAKYKRDIIFDKRGTKLEASRVTVQLRYVGPRNQSRAMHLFRRLAETAELNTGVYADFFQFAEQYSAVLPATITTIAIAGAAVIIVSLLFIPETIASICVALTIVSINMGILGFMTFWDVRLDFISMVTIVMSIGFCVDFASHLAYNFAKGSDVIVSERMRNALYAVGTPILQSASSTIIGVSFLASTESYVFRSFLKTIVLVITLGALHGLVFLPVLLTLFYSNDTNNKRRQIYAISRPPRTDPRCVASIDTRPFSNIGKADIYARGNDCSGGGPTTAQLAFTKGDYEQYAAPRAIFSSPLKLGFHQTATPHDDCLWPVYIPNSIAEEFSTESRSFFIEATNLHRRDGRVV